ncbi:DUF1254 domain-containing protein [Haliea sp. E1-2-M8]|uniref:DUF1254 domain-containing protein n=1 Tax=Haliea sp. E1-2-M8 TaxID=3064706 RepID=UPI002719EBC1|nr:DUF1254 domain-containing protein [Haliea sp. E1-2-M8]MDO8862978.1 DUF1254 domain-containing protein [Haliea sp. E1-2-M8]
MHYLKSAIAVALVYATRGLGAVSLLAVLLGVAGVKAVAAAPTSSRPDPAAIIEHRQQALAYVAGLQAYFYGYPVVDYLRVMRDQITPERDPGGVYAPVNQIAFQDNLAEPGGLYAGRGPNTSTLYFTAWMDLTDEPVLIEAPDTDGRYYVLTYADMYSEVQHSGRRTTGTGAQQILVVGPNWQGEAPEEVQIMPMRTHQAYLLGRVLVDGPDDLAAARQVMYRFRMTGAQRPPADFALPEREALTSLAFFEVLNSFLRENPRIEGEELLMAQMNQVGIGPNAEFLARSVPAGIRRGLERYAVTDRMSDLKRRADGSVVVRLQQTRPDTEGVNWLPVNDGPLFVTLRFFEPAAEVLAGEYAPPAIRRLP